LDRKYVPKLKCQSYSEGGGNSSADRTVEQQIHGLEKTTLVAREGGKNLTVPGRSKRKLGFRKKTKATTAGNGEYQASVKGGGTSKFKKRGGGGGWGALGEKTVILKGFHSKKRPPINRGELEWKETQPSIVIGGF